MGRKSIPGLIKRAGIWHIDKRIGGRRVCRSTETAELQEAERYLARVMEQTRQAQVYGVRPSRTFEQAAAKFVLENQHKRSIGDDVSRLKGLIPWIGSVSIDKLNMGTLKPWIEDRRSAGCAAGTINNGLQIVRRILNLAASEWMDEHGLTWIHASARIKLIANPERRQPHPLDWDEQTRLFAELPGHLAEMALFAVNTGCRDSEICGLRWDWEVRVPELDTIVFIVPGTRVKNGAERLVVLNRVARSVVDSCRSRHQTHVFTYQGKPVHHILNSAWKKARTRAALPMVRVHDLKHTFGRRLRAAGVNFEDRQDLLGHRSARITTHYSAAELSRLIEATEKVVERNGKRPELVVLRGKVGTDSRKPPASAPNTEPKRRLTH
jgi:integrase